jgi:hypothetical protein
VHSYVDMSEFKLTISVFIVGAISLACQGEVDPPTHEAATEVIVEYETCDPDRVLPSQACSTAWRYEDWASPEEVADRETQMELTGWCWEEFGCLPSDEADVQDAVDQLVEGLRNDLVAAGDAAIFTRHHLNCTGWYRGSTEDSVQRRCTVHQGFRRSTDTEVTYRYLGMTEAEVRAARRPPFTPLPATDYGELPPDTELTCLSCDQLPVDTDEEVRAKAGCMIDGHRIALREEGATVLKLERNLKLLYEVKGEAFTSSQRSAALGLYEGRPENRPDCGPRSTLEPSCAPMEQHHWRFDFCARLTGEHVSGGLLDAHYGHAYGRCTNLLTRLAHARSECTLESEVEEALALNDTLLEKILGHMGDSLQRTADPETRVHRVATALDLLSMWFEDLSVIEADPELDAHLERVMTSFWREIAQARSLNGDILAALLAASTVESNRPLEERLQNVERENVDIDVFASALEGNVAASLDIDRDVFIAAHTSVRDNGVPSARGRPLLAISGEILGALTDRLDTLGHGHDIACGFAQCRTNDLETPVSATWALVGAMTHDDLLAREIAEVSVDLDGWTEAFAAVRPAHTWNVRAISDVFAGYDPSQFDALDSTQLPVSVHRYFQSVGLARQRTASYRARGYFETASDRSLVTSAEAAKRDDIVSHIASKRAELEGRLSTYDRDLVGIVHGILAELQNEATLARLDDRRRRIADDIDLLIERSTRHKRAVAELDTYSELVSQFERTSGVYDGGQFFNVTSLAPFDVSGASASELDLGATSIATLRTGPMVPIERGQVLSVGTEGRYAAACELNRRRLLRPDTYLPMSVDSHGVLVGPEGYSVAWTGSRYLAGTAARSRSMSATIGLRGEICIGNDTAWFGVSAKACVYNDNSITESRSHTDSAGFESRTAASFESGLFLSVMPISSAPVGSLVIVEMPRGATLLSDVRDIHVLRSPHTTITVGDDADLYFVVNDWRCRVADSTNRITVRAAVLQSAETVSEQLLGRISAVLEYVRDRETELVRRGEVLPSELTSIRNDANLYAIQSIGVGGPVLDVSEYPTPLRTMYEAFLSRELVRLERAVRIASIDREIELLIREHNALLAELQHAQSADVLLQLVPTWGLRNLDADYVFATASRLGDDMRTFVLPVLDLWYHEVLAALAADPDVLALLDMSPNAPMRDVTSNMVALARKIGDELAHVDLRNRDTETARRLVALSFPRPDGDDTIDLGGFTAFEPGDFGAGVLTEHRRVDRARAAALWTSIEQSAEAIISVSPRDIYELGGTATLSCYEELPVLRHLGLAVIRQGDGENADVHSLDRLQTKLIGYAGFTQTFASERGPVTYTMDNAQWLSFEAPYVYTNFDNPLAVVNAALYTPQGAPRTNVIGLSPFNEFEFLFNPVDHADLLDATEVVMVMELESTTTSSTPLTWIDRCVP